MLPPLQRPLGPSALLLLAVLVLGACRGTMSIGELLDDPGRYDGETVRVRGTVESSAGLLGAGAYRLDDGTGTLNVVNRDGGVPREGARVGVEGEFRSVFTIGATSQAVLLERGRFDP